MRGCDRQSLRGSPGHWSAHRMEWRFSVILSDTIRLERYKNVTARYRLPPTAYRMHLRSFTDNAADRDVLGVDALGGGCQTTFRNVPVDGMHPSQ